MGKSTSDKSLKLETYITRRKLNPAKEDNEKQKRKDSVRKVSLILRKCETSRTPEEKRLLETCSDIAKNISKRKARNQLYKDRIIEKEDPIEVIERKSERLAQIISRAKHLVCYTGAGISTSARIPDYRGSQGIWTLLQQGKEIGQHDLSLADPTYTHMALYELHRRKMLRFVVSQNCDGLHLRAGLPKSSLSEVHGNMYIEVCKNCKPNVEYWRLFDTTELTARFYHKTNRRCHICNKPLNDTIVHFGERGNLKWPLNWAGACSHSENADVILCLGSSLKVLKKYSWLWQMDKPLKKRAKLCIINLQWTPKDKLAGLKINGKCDEVMQKVMKYLNINVPEYTRHRDPIFSHATMLCTEELHTVSQPMLRKTLKKLEGEEDDADDDSHEVPSEHNELNAFTSSDNDSATTIDNLDSENSNTPKKDLESNIKDESMNGEIIKKSLTPVKRPKPSPLKLSPAKTVSFVKTNLNSKHLILADVEKSCSSEEDESEKGTVAISSSSPKAHFEKGAEVTECSNELNMLEVKEEKVEVETETEPTKIKTEPIEGNNTNPVQIPGDCKFEEKVSGVQSKEEVRNMPPLSEYRPEQKISNEWTNPMLTKVGCDIFQENGTSAAYFSGVRDIKKSSDQYSSSNPFKPCSLARVYVEKPVPALIPFKLEKRDLQAGTTNSKQLDRKIDVSGTDFTDSISSRFIENKRKTSTCDSIDSTASLIFGSIDANKHLPRAAAASSIGSNVSTLISSTFHIVTKQGELFKSSYKNMVGLGQRQLFDINSIDLSRLVNSEEYCRNFFEYCKAVEQKLPYWYDVGYAYSGLHSIIQPPPPEIDLWSSKIVPIFNMNKNEAECEFCFENYAEFKCQFYRKYNPEFAIKKYRNNKVIACECCDYTDEDEREDNDNENVANLDETKSDFNEKRAKLDMQVLKEPVKIQAGWYGKGYKKNFRRRRR